jgi:hypothetical protein
MLNAGQQDFPSVLEMHYPVGWNDVWNGTNVVDVSNREIGAHRIAHRFCLR